MTTVELALVLPATYKIISLLVGAFISFLGYKLFMNGIWGEAGDVDAKFKDGSIVIRSAAPGTFFALFGAIIIGVTILKGWDVDVSSNAQNALSANILGVIDDGESLPDELPF